MKFCPFCGIATIPGDRFCQGCGALLADESVQQSSLVEAAMKPAHIIKERCIHCGNYLEPDDKFCLECGNKVEAVEEVVTATPHVVASPIQEVAAKPVCKQCGSELIEGDRYCAECGADTLSIPIAAAVPEPVVEPVVQQPIIKPPTPPTPPIEAKQVKPAPVPAPESTKAAKKPTEPIAKKVEAQEPAPAKKSKVWIVALACIVVLGGLAGVWFFVLDKGEPETAIDSTTLIAQTQPIAVEAEPTVDSAAILKAQEEANQAKQAASTPEPSKQEQAKPKSTKKDDPSKSKKDARKTTANAKKEEPKQQKTDFQVVKKTNKTPIIIYSNWNEKPVKNNPWTKTRFDLNSDVVITRIKTLHYNKGEGVPVAGTISLVDENRVTYGPWQCTAQTADDGTPSAKWVCEPNAIVPAGKYKVVNSGEDTWSWNADSDRKGFIIIEGYQK